MGRSQSPRTDKRALESTLSRRGPKDPARGFASRLRCRPVGVPGEPPSLRRGLPGCSSLLLNGEAQLSEHPDGACLPALEVTGAKSLAPGELIGCAQDCFRRITASFPGELISRRRGEAMLGEEPLR